MTTESNTKKTPGQEPEVQSKFACLDELHLGGIELELEAGEFVAGDDLALALRGHGLRPLSEPVLDYLCRYLNGEIKPPKGRRPDPPSLKQRQFMIVTGLYHRNLTWLQKRKKRHGHLNGWSAIRKADFWQGPPSEIAARMTARRWWYNTESWRTVVNIASSQQKAPLL